MILPGAKSAAGIPLPDGYLCTTRFQAATRPPLLMTGAGAGLLPGSGRDRGEIPLLGEDIFQGRDCSEKKDQITLDGSAPPGCDTLFPGPAEKIVSTNISKIELGRIKRAADIMSIHEGSQ